MSKRTRKKWAIRITTEGNDRASSAYAIRRSSPLGRSISADLRPAKVSRADATTFKTEKEANRMARSMQGRFDGVVTVFAV